MKTIFCVRHGHSTGDVEGRFGGSYDDDLSPLGIEQAAALAGELASAGIQKIYSSSLKRAVQTSQAILQKVDCDLSMHADLQERDRYGVLSGLTKTEAQLQFPELAELVRDRKQTLPNAESDAEASQRMLTAFEQICGSAPDCAAIVWHGGGMRALFRDYLKLGEVTEAGDCCWVELCYDADSGRFKLADSRRLHWQA